MEENGQVKITLYSRKNVKVEAKTKVGAVIARAKVDTVILRGDVIAVAKAIVDHREALGITLEELKISAFGDLRLCENLPVNVALSLSNQGPIHVLVDETRVELDNEIDPNEGDWESDWKRKGLTDSIPRQKEEQKAILSQSSAEKVEALQLAGKNGQGSFLVIENFPLAKNEHGTNVFDPEKIKRAIQIAVAQAVMADDSVQRELAEQAKTQEAIAEQAKIQEAEEATRKGRWRSIKTACLMGMAWCNPGNYALFSLTCLSAAIIIAKFATVGVLAVAAPVLLSFALSGALLFAGTLVFFAFYEPYRHYTAARYKHWKLDREEKNKNNKKDDELLSVDYNAYLQDKRFEFGFLKYFSSLIELAKKHQKTTVLIWLSIVIWALLVSASIGFFCGNEFAMHLMQPFIDLMVSVLSLATDSFSVHAMTVIAAVIAPLFSLVIVDAIRRIAEMFNEADEHAKDTEYCANSDDEAYALRPEVNTWVGMDRSLAESIALKRKDFDSYVASIGRVSHDPLQRYKGADETSDKKGVKLY